MKPQQRIASAEREVWRGKYDWDFDPLARCSDVAEKLRKCVIASQQSAIFKELEQRPTLAEKSLA
jgi:hypothetical protein